MRSGLLRHCSHLPRSCGVTVEEAQIRPDGRYQQQGSNYEPDRQARAGCVMFRHWREGARCFNREGIGNGRYGWQGRFGRAAELGAKLPGLGARRGVGTQALLHRVQEC